MSRFFWDSQLLSPFLVTSMDHKPLKRSRSTESLERSFKRSKPFQIEPIDTPLSLASEPSPNTATTPIAYPINTLYPNPTLPYHAHQTKQEQQQEQQQQYHQSFLGPISISTKTDNSYISLTEAAAAAATMAGATPLSATDYENINGVLYSAHVERFGDPETRERWWQETEDIEMGEEGQEVGEEGQEVAEEQDSISNNEYNSVNSVLRQAFLARYQRQQQH